MLSLKHGRGSCKSVTLCLTSTLEMLHLVFRQTGGRSSKMFLNYWYPSKLLKIYCRWNQCMRSGFRLCRDVDSTTIYQHLFFFHDLVLLSESKGTLIYVQTLFTLFRISMYSEATRCRKILFLCCLIRLLTPNTSEPQPKMFGQIESASCNWNSFDSILCEHSKQIT